MTGVTLKMKCGALEKLGHQDKAEGFVRVQVQERCKKMSGLLLEYIIVAQSLQTDVYRKLYCV